mgnify:CR=1 FL=1
MEASVSLITFDSQSIEVIRDKAPAGSCAELVANEYQPRASTPLLDAVGYGVSAARQTQGARRSAAILARS